MTMPGRGASAPLNVTLAEAGQAAERGGRRAEARGCYERALQACVPERDAKQAATLLRFIARTYHADGAMDEAADCIAAALLTAEATGDPATIGWTVNYDAILHRQRAQLDEAQRLFERARQCASEAGDTHLSAGTSQNLGVIANIRGDLALAQRYYEESLAEFRLLGSARDVCATLNNLGMLFTDLERWADAARSLNEAITISTVVGETGMQILAEVNMAELHLGQRDFGGARTACDRAKQLSERVRDVNAAGDLQKHYGVIAREGGDPVQAEAHFAEAERLAAARSDLLLAAETARERAELYRGEGRYRDTLMQLNRSHKLFTQLQARRDLADVGRRMTRLEGQFLDVVRKWGASIESKDRYTQGHCERVSDVACAIAIHAGFDQRLLLWFRVGAMLHDVGKLMIPEEVLNKPERLTPEEWQLVRAHPATGVQMLSMIEFPWDILPMVRSHHERWDGRGYPDALAGGDIPREARILCIADVYDALTSTRSYKRALSHQDAVAIMREDAGTQFDPELFAIFEQVVAPSLVSRTSEQRPAAPEGLARADLPRDELTGVLTRKAIVDCTESALREDAARGTVTLLVIDIDRFKEVNDRRGHLAGDAALRQAAAVLQTEIGVLLPGSDVDRGRAVAGRLRLAMAESGRAAGTPAPTISIGVASSRHGRTSFNALFAAADRALYAAKSAGRDTVACEGDTDGATVLSAFELRQFVGREPELAQLRAALDESVAGEARLVLVTGEAGIGKTTLLRQLEPDVRLRAGSLITGRCPGGRVMRPYAPWAEIVETLHGMTAVPARPWSELSRLVDDLAPLGEIAPSGDGNRFRLFDEIASYLRLAAATRPLVVVLDDMQWADEGSWDVLSHVLGQLDDDRVLVVLTTRTEEMTPETIERRRVLMRSERTRELQLGRLSVDEVSRWVQRSFNSKRTDPAMERFLFDYTEGNPLLMMQALRTIIEEEAVRYEAGRWIWRPLSALRLPIAQQLMSRRIERLSSRTLQVITIAAVLGRRFEVDLLVAASGRSEALVLKALDEAHAAAIVEPEASGDYYCFTHNLLAEAITRASMPRRLRRLHESVARAILAIRPLAVDELVMHFDAARCRAEAYAYACEAGARARALYAHEQALTFYSIAERNAPDVEARREVWWRLGGIAEARADYAGAEEWYRRAHAPTIAGEERQHRLAIQRALVRLGTLRGRPAPEVLAASRALLTEAQRAGDVEEEVAAMTMVSEAHLRMGEESAAQDVAGACVALAEQRGLEHALGPSLLRLGSALLGSSAEQALQQYERARRLFADTGDAVGQARCDINIGIANSRLGRPAEADAAYDRALNAGRAAGAPDVAGLASLNLGVSSLRVGRLDASEAYLEESLRLFTAVRNQGHRVAALYNLAHLARERGDGARARDLYLQTNAIARELVLADIEIGSLAGAALSTYDIAPLAATAQEFETVMALLRDRAMPDWFQGREIVEALRVREALNRDAPDEAVGLLAAAMERAGAHSVYAAAWLAAETGVLLILRGAAEARALLGSALERVGAMGFLTLAGRLQSALALDVTEAFGARRRGPGLHLVPERDPSSAPRTASREVAGFGDTPPPKLSIIA